MADVIPRVMDRPHCDLLIKTGISSYLFCCCLFETGVHIAGLELAMWFRMSLKA